MIDYQNYEYAGELTFRKDAEGSHWSQQLGEAAERLVMMLLGRIGGYRVARVDYEGADLIASRDGLPSSGGPTPDAADKKIMYAISVKAHQFGPNETGETHGFEKKDQDKLLEFAETWNAVPAVAFVFAPRDFAYIDVFVLTLNALKELAEQSEPGPEARAVRRGAKDEDKIWINILDLGQNRQEHSDRKGYQKYLHENDLIAHTRLEVRNRKSLYQGIPLTQQDLDDVYRSQSSYRDDTQPLELAFIARTKMLGHEGEYLVMLVLQQQKQYNVMRIDHEGADLIAVGRDGRRYAISVKTTAVSNEFTWEIDKLTKCAQDFGGLGVSLIPVVAGVRLSNDATKGQICILPVKALEGPELNLLTLTQSEKRKLRLDDTTIPKLREMPGVDYIEFGFSQNLNPDEGWEYAPKAGE